MIALLKQQLTEPQAREHAAQERERDSREHIARLTAMLDQAHQQNQRLLDLPRATRLSGSNGAKMYAKPSSLLDT